MKKFIAVLTLCLAFSISAKAQESKLTTAVGAQPTTATPLEKGQKEATALSEYLGLDKSTTENFVKLFEQKNTILQDKSVSQERRNELARVTEAKIRATLDAKQIEKLDKNPELLKDLIN